MSYDTLELVCYVSYRLFLPAVLVVAACIRISIVSLVWLMFFLVVPCLPKFSFRNWLTHKSLRVYIILLLIISTLACCGHVVFWALQLSHKLDFSATTLCNSTNILLMNIGYESLSADVVPNVLDRVRLIMPDFVVFVVAVVTTILCFNSPAASPDHVGKGVTMTRFWRTIEPFVTSLCLFLAGAAAPSLVSGVYFFTFMIVSTLWAVGIKFGKLPHVKLFLLVLCGVQIVTLYIYQFKEVHTHLPPDSLTARLLGYVQYYTRTCKVEGSTITANPLHLQFTDKLQIGDYAFIVCLTALYFSLGLSARYMAKGSAARVGLKALKENTRRSIKRMVSVSQHGEGGVDITGEQEPGRSSDISENTRSGDEMVVLYRRSTWLISTSRTQLSSFKQNQRVKAKVLTVDPSKRRLTLTLKRSVVKNSTADVTGYETLEKNQQVTGWIAAIKQFGIIMNFTSKIRGLVHSSEISNVPMTEADICKLYRLGQVLSCRVVHVNPEKEKLSLSLNLLEEFDTKNSEEKSARWARRGQIHSCTVLSRAKGVIEGFIVQLDATKEEAFLPTHHLSDYATLSDQKTKHLQPGSKIEPVLVISKKMKKVNVTAKSSIVCWAKSFKEMPKISDLSVGDFIVGYIKDFQDYGCFIEIGNGLVGLCPKACLADNFVSNPKDVYSLGETVMCKITNIDTEKERLLVSLKHSDVGSEPSLTGSKLLEGYFKELDTFADTVDQPAGSIVECNIESVSEKWYEVKVGEAPVMVDRTCAEGELKAGDKRKGVVLDHSAGTYYLSLEPELVESVEGRGKRKKLTKGAEMSATVVLTTEDYFVVVLPGADHRFGYVHRRAHLSDQGSSYKDVKCGDEQTVTISRDKKGTRLLLSFVSPTPETVTTQPQLKRKREDHVIKFDDINIGEVYTVTVKSVKQLQLNVQLSQKVNGRVHITEVTDSPEPSSNPLKEYKHGDSLHVKLIGFRHSKTHRYLPITRTDYVRSMGEFSLRDSVINSTKVREIKDNEKVDETKDLISSLVVGQQITGYVKCIDHSGFLWISLSPGVEARLWHTLTSSDKEEVEKWTERFTVGQCITATVFSTRDNKIDLSLVGALTADAKFWCLVKGTLPGIGVKLQLTNRDFGIAPLTELNDNYTKDPLSKYHENDLVQCVVVVPPTSTDRRMTLSLRKSRTSQRWKKATGGRKAANKIISNPADLEVDSVYSGYVRSTSATAGIYVSLGYNVTGRVLMKNMSDNFLKNWEPMFPLGKLVKVFVLHTDPKVELSMKLSDLKKGSKKEEEEEGGEEEVQRCLDDILLEKYQDSDGGSDGETGEADESDDEVMEVEDAPKIVFTSKKSVDSTNVDEESVSLREVLAEEKESDSEEEDGSAKTDEPEAKKGKSFLKREKKRKKEEAEEEIRKIEMKSNSSSLETEDDFEREVASKPDSGASWVCYMAYWLGLGNVDKARLTAKRALDTINYRLEEEKLNVWSALFNLENSFGTHEGLMAVCKDAAAVNDSKAVFLRLAAVLDKSKKYQELDDVYSSVLLKKYKRARKVWCNYCSTLATQQRLDEMRELLAKALKSLPKHKHIRTICHFAQTEYKQGDPNRGSTMFENVLTTYPHRLDLWAVYLDKTIALNDHQQSRLLLDRMVGLKLPIKKMRFFFKRYIDFETAHGDEAKLNSIREKAQNYLSSNQDD
ncbi:protein RRP5 homolog [Bolinopsis microptera]|uniref:protein RRP5 homolog n=1 Tax=Bolinopsis microptera TaxID=2820187 RepID=UPI00307A1033